jgi:hypothetical protein
MTTTEPTTTSTERWFAELGVTHTYEPVIDLDLIDDQASLRNQARFEPIHPDVVDRYAEDMRRGDTFPPVIARRRRNGQLIILGGNHRVAAAREARTPLSAWVVECSDEMALRICLEDNRRHGLPPSDTERIAQAIHLIALGWTQQAAAAVVGVHPNKVSRARGEAAAGERVRTLHIKGDWDGLPSSSKSRLSALRSDPVFAAATQLVLDAGVNAEGVYELVTKLNSMRSDNDALEVVAADRVKLAEQIDGKKTGRTTTVRQPPSPRAQLLDALTRIRFIDPHDVAAATLPDQRQDVFKRLRLATEQLIAIDKALRAR